ncbi:MAG: HepT-like ribonuclease domain-containing protein [Limisphaera sp.]
MTVKEVLREKREAILQLCAKYGARNVRGFGSAVRGEDREGGDVDFLVDFEPSRSLLDRAGLVLELEELLGRKAECRDRGRTLLAPSPAHPQGRSCTMKKDRRICLAHMLECIQKIERFTAGGKGRFLADELVQDAVLRNFEVIGEAAKRLDDVHGSLHPEIPWRALAGLRDVLIHQYEAVDLERVWPSARTIFRGSNSPSPRSCRLWSSPGESWQGRMSRPKTTKERGHGG